MTKRTSTKKTDTSLIRSSAAEYLTFIAASGQGDVEAVYADEIIWLTQKMMGSLYDVNVRTVNDHLKRVFSDSDLQEDSVIRKFRITASDGKNYNTLHYKLPAIIAVGYKVNSERAVQFRKKVGYPRHRAVHHQGLVQAVQPPTSARARTERPGG
jgi:hypothetical protein